MAILTAVDDAQSDEKALLTAYDLATTYGEDLFVLSVISTDDYEKQMASFDWIPELDNPSHDQLINGAEQMSRRITEEIIADTNEINIVPIGYVGDVQTGILQKADQLKPRFLVISARRRTPAGKAIFGDVAQQILLNATCPVVTVMGNEE